jgi:alpha-D-ribose 1-methylphosphonate 5-triphosphate diphosphatase
MPESLFRNARLVTADAVLDGALAVADGIITEIGVTRAAEGIDCAGDFLIPGLVELHTDQLEAHYRPRPGVFWHAVAAVQAHDAQLAASGITTVFDALRIGSDVGTPGMADHIDTLLAAVETARADERLRADHRVHLRCELPAPDVVAHFERFYRRPIVGMASVMDHTPGQRQYRAIEKFRQYYQARMRFTDAEMDAFIADKHQEQAKYSEKHRRAILKLGHAAGLTFSSHDDATPEQVAESVADGVRIAEFPTTVIAAEQSHAAGLAVLMGAPNIVRGASHSGNVSALALAGAGVLDILSSDYIPFALLQAAFALPQKVSAVSLPAAIAMVTKTPAGAAGLADRGELVPGRRADLVRVRLIDGIPVVKGVWRQGERVS